MTDRMLFVWAGLTFTVIVVCVIRSIRAASVLLDEDMERLLPLVVGNYMARAVIVEIVGSALIALVALAAWIING